MSIIVGGVTIDGNEVDVSLSASVVVDSFPWLLRDSALNSRSVSGHKSVEVELLTGVRVLVQSTTGSYVDVPMNNDDVITRMDRVFSVIIASISATAVDADGLDSLANSYKASMLYYANKRILLNKMNDSSFSYPKKLQLHDDLINLAGSGLDVTVPGAPSGDWEFSESGGLNISYWANGPYADIKLVVQSRKLLTL